MAKISQLEKETEQVFPVTTAGAVFFTDGETAEQKIKEIKSPDKLSGPAYNVLAEHIALLTKRVEALESSRDIAGNLNAESVDTRNGYTIKGDALILAGSTAPEWIPSFIGQFYINLMSPALYYATGTNTIDDWKQV